MRGGGGRGPGRRAGGRRGASQARRVTGRARPCGGRGGELCLRHRGWRVGRACCWRRGAPYAAPRPPARQVCTLATTGSTGKRCLRWRRTSRLRLYINNQELPYNLHITHSTYEYEDP
uniref:Uncharacterized protein n=1 Tax=Triticum urartu TaxID=4572 RepID=A0A8R7Q371_TRIUA